MTATTPDTPTAGPGRQRTADELRALAEQGARELGPDATADEVAAWAARTFPGTLAVACSMADAVLPAVVAKHAPGVDVLFLDTGYHFAETYGTRAQVAHELDVTVVDVLPRAHRGRAGRRVRPAAVRARPGGLLPDAQGRAAAGRPGRATRRG